MLKQQISNSNIVNSKLKEKEKMADKMKCMLCGHVYEQEKGDKGVAPGTAWDDVPSDWVCPICGARKSSFVSV